MEIFWIRRWSHFEEKIIFFKKITDYQQFSPVNDMLSTPIGKGYIILINDKSLWGKYVLRNADFRFSAQIRSHFLLHQKANHHRYFEGYPYFLPALHWHTNGDISWDIPSFLLSLNRHTNCDTPWDIPAFLLLLHRHTNCDTAWDIPSFSLPSIYQPLGALLRTPPLFHHPSFVPQTMTSVGIPQHFRPQRKETLLITSNSSAIVL